MDELVKELLGPNGVAIGAIALVMLLGRLHLKADTLRDKELAVYRESQPTLIDSNKVMAETIRDRLSKADGK